MFPTKQWNARRSGARKKYEGSSFGISNRSSLRTGACSGQIVRCAKPFGSTFVITLLAVLIFRFRSSAVIELTPPRLWEAEAASCEGVVTTCVVPDALKQAGLNKIPRQDDLSYEVYLRLPHMFLPILTGMFNHWFAQESILFVLLRAWSHCWKNVAGMFGRTWTIVRP